MFSTVTEKRGPYTQDCKLFKLPDDILAEILEWLIAMRVDFRPLALASRDFRQFARSHQFRVVTFDGSDRCLVGILAQLKAEAVERQQGFGLTQKPSIGACIRIVSINTGVQVLRHKSKKGRREEFEIKFAARLDKSHYPLIRSVIASLPKLDVLNFSGVTLSQSLVDNFVGHPIERVTLDAKMTAVRPRMKAGVSWPISRLSLKLSVGKGSPQNCSLYWEDILRLCAPTLEQLSMSHWPKARRFWGRRGGGPLSFNLRFPELTHLDIKWAGCLDPSALRSLLFTSKKLHYLSIDCNAEEVREIMNTPDGFAALRTLVANFRPRSISCQEMTEMPLTFVANLPEITSFAFTRKGPQAFTENVLAELRHFPRLEKLLMVLDNTLDQQPLLQALSTSVSASLEELHLVIAMSDPNRRW